CAAFSRRSLGPPLPPKAANPSAVTDAGSPSTSIHPERRGRWPHYILRVIWHMLHEAAAYRPPDRAALDEASILRKGKRVMAELRKLGYTVSVTPPITQAQAAKA